MDIPSGDVVLYSAIALIIVENFVEIYFFHRVSPKNQLFSMRFFSNKNKPLMHFDKNTEKIGKLESALKYRRQNSRLCNVLGSIFERAPHTHLHSKMQKETKNHYTF